MKNNDFVGAENPEFEGFCNSLNCGETVQIPEEKVHAFWEYAYMVHDMKIHAQAPINNVQNVYKIG